jgi:hypothetical protein
MARRELAIGLAAVMASFVGGFLATVSPEAQAPSPAGQFASGYKAARTADGKPDFNGLWQAMTEANWNLEDHAASAGVASAQIGIYGAEPPGLGVVDGGAIPYQPAALAKKKANLAKRVTADPQDRFSGDPEAKCYMPGLPRATYMPHPFQIIQGTDKVVFAYQFADTGRIVYLGTAPQAPADSWMGMSSAKFEGDTLVITATDFNDESWFDRAGNYHSDALKVTERFTPASPYHLLYEATMEDPKIFTRPWKISFPLYRRMEKNARLLEFKCVEFSEEFLYGMLRRPASR